MQDTALYGIYNKKSLGYVGKANLCQKLAFLCENRKRGKRIILVRLPLSGLGRKRSATTTGRCSIWVGKSKASVVKSFFPIYLHTH